MTSQREEFEKACSLLPADVNWSDPITPDIVLDIWQAATKNQDGIRFVGRCDRGGSKGDKPVYRLEYYRDDEPGWTWAELNPRYFELRDKNQADEIERLKLDIAEALQAVTNQSALIAATIQMCAQKCNNIATSNGNSDCTKIAADWCGRVILSLVPEDAQRELDELLMKACIAGANAAGKDMAKDIAVAIIEGAKK